MVYLNLGRSAHIYLVANAGGDACYSRPTNTKIVRRCRPERLPRILAMGSVCIRQTETEALRAAERTHNLEREGERDERIGRVSESVSASHASCPFQFAQSQTVEATRMRSPMSSSSWELFGSNL
jgi:hypothetical protein